MKLTEKGSTEVDSQKQFKKEDLDQSIKKNKDPVKDMNTISTNNTKKYENKSNPTAQSSNKLNV